MSNSEFEGRVFVLTGTTIVAMTQEEADAYCAQEAAKWEAGRPERERIAAEKAAALKAKEAKRIADGEDYW